MKKLMALGLMLLSLGSLGTFLNLVYPQLASAEIRLTQQTSIPQSSREVEQIKQEGTPTKPEPKRTQFNQLLARFSDEFGYNPKNYELSFLVSGSNTTVFDTAYWIKFQVKPEEGIVKVAHTTSVIDWFWGTTNWYDHQTVSIRFILDPDACQAILQGNNCQVTGQDQIKLPDFLNNHQIIKHGLWEIKYIEGNETRQVAFRVPENELPKGSNERTSMTDINTSFCQIFPDGLACKK